MRPTTWVVGSLNADLVQIVDRLPLAGETITGRDLKTIPGGKGANQAFAAAKLGADVRMVGNTGNDQFGDLLAESLLSVGVNLEGVLRSDFPTGTATILVTPDGENSIIVSRGANSSLSPKDVQERLSGIKQGDFLLCQLEVPTETVIEAMKIARESGAEVIFDPAPATSESIDELIALSDYITPNESETLAITKTEAINPSDKHTLSRTAENLKSRGARNIILKLGEYGCYFYSDIENLFIQAHNVTAVDTTGAGDTFNAALAVRLSERASQIEAVKFACTAAAISVTRTGAQPAIPSRSEVDTFNN